MQKCRDFNLIVTCQRNREYFTIRELESLLYTIKVKNYKLCKSDIKGIILAKIGTNPHEFVNKLRFLLKERPWEFRNIKRVIPIDVVVPTDYELICKSSWNLSSSIPSNSTFKVKVKKRYTDLSSRELIELIASKINRKVDLKNPDYIIDIEILGNVTGISLLKGDEILSVEKELLK